jgi:hypothetical protein
MESLFECSQLKVIFVSSKLYNFLFILVSVQMWWPLHRLGMTEHMVMIPIRRLFLPFYNLPHHMKNASFLDLPIKKVLFYILYDGSFISRLALLYSSVYPTTIFLLLTTFCEVRKPSLVCHKICLQIVLCSTRIMQVSLIIPSYFSSVKYLVLI